MASRCVSSNAYSRFLLSPSQMQHNPQAFICGLAGVCGALGTTGGIEFQPLSRSLLVQILRGSVRVLSWADHVKRNFVGLCIETRKLRRKLPRQGDSSKLEFLTTWACSIGVR